LPAGPLVRSGEVSLAARLYWQVCAETLQMSEQQSKSEVQKPPVGPQHLQLVAPGGCRHCPLVPSALRQGRGLHDAP